MRPRSPSLLKTVLLAAAIACLLQSGSLHAAANSESGLAANFAHPPFSAGPWVYWFWCNGNVTKEGITGDLEAMKRVGIAGVLIMDTNVSTPAGPARYGSAQWHELIRFAISEAARLGLKVNMTNAPGWAGSGGPWNTPGHSEQKLVWTELQVQGPKRLDQVLARPQVVENYYGEVALLAYPTPGDGNSGMADFSPKFSVSGTASGVDPQILGVPDSPEKKAVILPRPGPGVQPYVQVELSKPFTARSLSATMQVPPDRVYKAEVESSQDGVNFKAVGRCSGDMMGIDVPFDAVTARFFRLVFTGADEYMPPTIGVLSLTLDSRAHFEVPVCQDPRDPRRHSSQSVLSLAGSRARGRSR